MNQLSDYYKALGVKEDANDDEIKKSFRKLARKYHPDHNKDPGAEPRFKEISEAYAVLSDSEKRRQYDAARRGGTAFNFNFDDLFGAGGLDEILRGFGFAPMGGRRPGGRAGVGGRPATGGFFFPGQGQNSRPANLRSRKVRAAVTPRELIEGSHLTIGRGTMKIPAGSHLGMKLRFQDEGVATEVNLELDPSSGFEADGDDLITSVIVPFSTLVLGGKAMVEGVTDSITVKVRAGSQGGSKLRLKGQGLPKKGGGRGNLYVRLQVRVPKDPSKKIQDLAKELLNEGQ